MGYAIVIEGSPLVAATSDVTSITTYGDSVPSDVTVVSGMLGRPTFSIEERLHPLEGNLSVSALDFVIHDPDMTFAAAHTIDEDTAVATFMTAAITSGNVTLTVDSSAAVGATPCFIHVGGECMQATAAPTGTTLTVVRGRRGTLARAIDVDSSIANIPQVFTSAHWLVGRRLRFYKVSGTVATLRWIGYVKQGPVASENSASWIVSAVHAWEHESNLTVAAPASAATLSGYDATAITIALFRQDDVSVDGSATTDKFRARCNNTIKDAIEQASGYLVANINARAGFAITNASRTVAQSGNEYLVVLTADGLDGNVTGTLAIGGVVVTANGAADATGRKRITWRIRPEVNGALVRAGFNTGNFNAPTTVIAPTVSLPTGGWTPTNVGGVRLTRMLVADIDDESTLDLDPTGCTSPGLTSPDATNCDPSRVTFQAKAVVTPRDIANRVSPDRALINTNRQGITMSDALPLRVEVKMECEHWLEALKVVMEDTVYCGTNSDSRNWDWTSKYDGVTRRTRGDLAKIRWRISGTRKIGDFMLQELAVRGCCVSVRAGKLLVVDVRGSNPAGAASATFTDADLCEPPRYAAWSEGVATGLKVQTPFRAINIVDAVAKAQFGEQRTIDYVSEGLRDDDRAVTDPVDFSRRFMPSLRRYGRVLYVHTLTVPTEKFDATYIGDDVQFSSYTAPTGTGTRGLTAKRGIVVSRTDDLGAGKTTFDILALAPEYGWAPCARVASIAGAVLTLASAYAGGAGDYAGATLTGYAGTTGDKGATMFAAGDVVELTLRDTATYTIEQYTVLSVNGTSGTITMTVAINAAPTAWAALCAGGSIVDVRHARFNAVQSSQKVYAVVSDKTTRAIDGTATKPRKWAP